MILKVIKRASLHAASDLGLFRLFRDSHWRRRRLLILCYHGISLEDEHDWNPALYMAPQVFEQRLRLLKEGGYSVLQLDEAIRRLYSNSLPGKSVTITFDDGTYDFYKQAYPLLRKYGFPVTVYLTTYYCDNNMPVFSLICSYMLWKKRGALVGGKGVPGLEEPLDLRTATARNKVLRSLVRYAKQEKFSARDKNQLAEALADHLGLDFVSLRCRRILHVMTPPEVAELARAGVDFQLHTHRHRSPLTQALYEKEIDDNRRRIQEITGNSPVHFCYPSGQAKPEFLPSLGRQNIVSAATCEPGLASLQTNALLLPRLVDHSHLAPIEFHSWLTGIGSLLPRAPTHAGNAD